MCESVIKETVELIKDEVICESVIKGTIEVINQQSALINKAINSYMSVSQ